jgi:ATP-binding cassette subfamily B protein
VGLVATPLVLLSPVPLKIAVDSAIGSDPLPGFVAAVTPGLLMGSPEAILVLAVVLLLGVALLERLQEHGNWLLATWAAERMTLDFRSRLFHHAQRLSLAYHDTRGTADAIYRILYDAPAIRYVAIEGVIPFLTAGVTVIGMVYVTARISPLLAAVALVVAPLLLLLTWLHSHRLRGRWRVLKGLESSALSVMQEALAAVRVVKAFGGEDREEERFQRVSEKGVRESLLVVWSESLFGVAVGLVMAGGTAAVLFLGVQQVRAGVVTLGELLLVMAYLARLYEPLKTIGRKAVDLQNSLVSAERAFALLDQGAEVEERPDARPLGRARGRIEFQDVAFAYDGERPVLREVDFVVPEGTRVGIAGPTGAGKSTLISLLVRFYDPTAGRILLDGVDLRDYRLADLRGQFALVLQETVLFSASIAENIGYARPGASTETIVEAARAANAHEFILGLPDGYDTEVGERGMRLSGGERQRVALARAFLKDAPILVLDEPTSAVDTETEAGILEAMRRLVSGRTTLMIAHRRSTLEGCDSYVTVEQGRLTPEPAPLRTRNPGESGR